MKTSASISPSMRFLAIILFFLTYSLPCFALTETYGGCYDTSQYRLGWSDFFWSYTIEDGGAIITNVATKNNTYFGTHTPEQIPAQLGGVPVTKISNSVFWCCYFAQAINIPNTVREIGRRAFGHCGNGAYGGGNDYVKELVIPNSVEIIGEGAFEHAGGQAITIGENVRIIGPHAFEGCRAVNEIHMGSSLTNCAAYAFCDVHTDNTSSANHPLVHSDELSVYVKDIATWCKIDFITNSGSWQSGQNVNSLLDSREKANGVKLIANGEEVIDLVVPEGVSKIGSLSFAGYTNLLSVTFPASLTTIGDYAFNFCTNITRISISDIASWCNLSVRTRLFDSIYDLYANAKKVTALSIPANITSIRDDLLRKCSSLEQLIVPASVTNIGYSSFAFCSSLKEVRFLGGPPNAQSTSFTNVASGAQGYYPAKHAAKWKTVIKNGMWCGLIMAEAKTPECILRVKSADPAEGSLTLAWEETVPVEGVTYAVYRSANDTYSATDLVTNGLTGTSWTDTAYWSAPPVLKPLNYWVVGDGGGYGERVSNRVETRRRFGVFVGLSDFDPVKFPEDKVKRLPSCVAEAKLFRKLAVQNGGTPADNAILLTTPDETKKKAIQKAFQNMGNKMQPGDFAFGYISTHGGANHGGCLLVYDDFYLGQDFMDDLSYIPTGAFMFFTIGACTSESMFQGGWDWAERSGFAALCPVNIAFLSACNWQESAWGMAGDYDEFETFLLKYGWQEGYANKDGDEWMTIREAVQYTQGNVRGSSSINTSHVVDQVPAAMLDVVLGNAPQAPAPVSLQAPTGVKASQGTYSDGILVEWNAVSGAKWYRVWRESSVIGALDLQCVKSWTTSRKFSDDCKTAFNWQNKYFIEAVGPDAISTPSEKAEGWPKNKFRDALVADGMCSESASLAEIMEIGRTATANGQTFYTCYVAGLDPNNPDASFEADLVREDGEWKAKPKGGEKEGRVYRVEGKKEMSDEAWTDVTTVEDLEAEGWHFFRVGVELAE